MKITQAQLRQIIREELHRNLYEGSRTPFPPNTRRKSKSWKAEMFDSKGKVVRKLDVTIMFEMLYTEMIMHIEDDPGAYITLTSADGKLGPYTLSTSDDIDKFAEQPREDEK